MKDNYRERIQAKLKASGSGSTRADLELHDVKVIESGTAARVLATYSDVFGPPSVFDVQGWLTARMGPYGNTFSARTDTVSVYPDGNFVTFVVEQKRLRQPLSATDQMVKAGVGQFLDADNQLWEVVSAEDGPDYIVRRESTSIEEMLEARRKALRGNHSTRKNVSLAAVEDSIPTAGGGSATVDLGDVVDFYHNGQIHRGKVNSAGSAGVKIASLNGGGVFTVDPAAITSIVEKSAASVKEDDDITRRYYSMVYPGNPEMVEIISPSSTAPTTDKRPPPGGEPLQPISVSAATGRVSGSARPFVKTSK